MEDQEASTSQMTSSFQTHTVKTLGCILLMTITDFRSSESDVVVFTAFFLKCALMMYPKLLYSRKKIFLLAQELLTCR